jgi:nitrogen fixation protein FixH
MVKTGSEQDKTSVLGRKSKPGTSMRKGQASLKEAANDVYQAAASLTSARVGHNEDSKGTIQGWHSLRVPLAYLEVVTEVGVG